MGQEQQQPNYILLYSLKKHYSLDIINRCKITVLPAKEIWEMSTITMANNKEFSFSTHSFIKLQSS